MEKFEKFTELQRNTLLAVWKSPSKKKKDDILRFIDQAEGTLRVQMDPIFPYPEWSLAEARESHSKIVKHAKCLRQTLEKLPACELWRIGALSDITVKNWKMPFPERFVPILAGLFMPIILKQLQIIEAVINEENRVKKVFKLKTGPNKTVEYWIIICLAEDYRREVGKVPAANTGKFYAFLKTLEPFVGLVFGESLLERAMKDYPN